MSYSKHFYLHVTKSSTISTLHPSLLDTGCTLVSYINNFLAFYENGFLASQKRVCLKVNNCSKQLYWGKVILEKITDSFKTESYLQLSKKILRS